ncbi:hypothetical protein [Rhizobium sophoriradicis]|uniref:hypothetical protein n=1 Tax=Rhizobium sophoriradicis TaxID=1535245 RepID=UPI001FE0F686|nr:hypothetical protein [Rhizobium sophoriradicis]
MKRFSSLRTLFFAPIVLIGLGAPAASAGQNECAGRAADLIRRAYPSATNATDGTILFDGATITLSKGDSVDGDPHAVICRVWPAQPQLTLIAVPLMTEQSDSENEGDIELLVVDSTNLQVRQRLRLDGLMSDDAFRVRSVAFDTARYQLAPKRTAFGLRVSREGSSRANPFGETTLWLFSIEGDRLKPVLDNIVVGESRDGIPSAPVSLAKPRARFRWFHWRKTRLPTSLSPRKPRHPSIGSERIMVATAKIRRRSANTSCGTTDRDMAFPKP